MGVLVVGCFEGRECEGEGVRVCGLGLFWVAESLERRIKAVVADRYDCVSMD